MRKSKQLMMVKRTRIATLYEENYSLRLIAHKLKTPRNIVHDTITLYNETDPYIDRRRTKRPKVTTSAKRNSIRLMRKGVGG